MKTIRKILTMCTAEQLFHSGFILTVFLILLIHGAGLRWRRDLRVDNRKAAPFPQWNFRKPAAFAPDLEKWLADRFCGRGDYISLWNRIRLHLFQESPHEQIIIGKRGYVFFASHISGKENHNSLLKLLLLWNDGHIQRGASDLESLKKKIRSVRIPVLFAAVPTKHSLYFDLLPEYLHNNFLRGRDGTPVHGKIFEELHRRDPEYADQYFLSVYPEAKKYTDKTLLFPPRNFHWVSGPCTHLTAHLIAKKFGRVQDDFFLDPRLYREQSIRSDLRFFFYKKLRTTAQVSRKDFLPAEEQGDDLSLFRRYPEIPGSREFSRLECYVFNPKARPGKILAFGDSFTNPMAVDLSRYFSEVITMEFTAMQLYTKPLADRHIREVVRIFKPDFIITISHGGFIFLSEACLLAGGRD